MNELAVFFRVQRHTIRDYMDRGRAGVTLQYRVRLGRKHPGVERIVDGEQLLDFLDHIWPRPMELDPESSLTHKEIRKRLDRVSNSMTLARAGTKRYRDTLLSPLDPLNPTLNNLCSESDRVSSEKDGPGINEVERKSLGPYQSEGESNEGCKGEGKRTEQVREEGRDAGQVEQSREGETEMERSEEGIEEKKRGGI